MASEMRPLRVIMREVVALVAEKATGVVLIVTEDNRFASVRLRSGHIEEVSFKNRYNDEGIHLLSQVQTLRARFQPGFAPPSTHPRIGEAAMRWLLGGFENQTPAPPSTPAAPRAPGASGSDEAMHQREIIERIALGYLGPIAGLLCEEAFSSAKGIDQALRQIASNLSEPGEGDRFLAEAVAAIRSTK